MKPLIDAFTLLTIVPLPFGSGNDSPPSRFAPLFFPVVGFIIGAFTALVYALLNNPVSDDLAAAIALTATVLLTGGLHIDGLADFFDGLFGGRDKDSRLRIMKQSDIGAFGVIAVLMVVLIQWNGISQVYPTHAWLVFPIVGAISRTAPLIVMLLTSYVSSSGLGSSYSNLPKPAILIVVLLAIASTFAYDGRFPIWAMSACVVAAGAVALVAKRRIGGANGDVYGASIEISYAAALVVAVTFFDSRYVMTL